MNIEQVWTEWKTEKTIGRGSYGTVYKCRNQNDGSCSAIKVISVPQDDYELSVSDTDGLSREQTQDYYKEIVDGFMSEIKILESLRGCRYIVGIEDSKVVEKDDGAGWKIFIRMELLTDFNTYASDKKLTENDAARLADNLTDALLVCGEKKIIHRDIKPENIFVDADGNFKLGDFGVAKQLEKTEASLSRKGTFNYMAPEILAAKKYDSRVDIYSLGLVMYKILNNNRLPFIDPDKQIIRFSERQEAFEKRIRGDKIPPLKNISDEMNEIILRACAFKPEERFRNIQEMKKSLSDFSSGKRGGKFRILFSKYKAAVIAAVIIAATAAGIAGYLFLCSGPDAGAAGIIAAGNEAARAEAGTKSQTKKSADNYKELKTHFGEEYSAGADGLYKYTEKGAVKLLDVKCQSAGVINDTVYYNRINGSGSYTLCSYSLNTKAEKEYFKSESPFRAVYSDESGIYSEDTVCDGLFYFDFKTEKNTELIQNAYGSTYCCGKIVTVAANDSDTLILYSPKSGETEKINCAEKMNNIFSGYILKPLITVGDEVFFTYSLSSTNSSSFGTLLLKYNVKDNKFESELNLEGDIVVEKRLSENEILLNDNNGTAYVYNTELYTLETVEFDFSTGGSDESYYFHPIDRQTAVGCIVKYTGSGTEVKLYKFDGSEKFVSAAPFDNISQDGLHDFYVEHEDSDFHILSSAFSDFNWTAADNQEE